MALSFRFSKRVRRTFVWVVTVVVVIIAGFAIIGYEAQAPVSGPVVNTIPLATGARPQMIAIAANGTYAYVANEGTSQLTVINLQTNSVVRNIAVATGPYAIAITPDGSKIVVGGNTDLSIVNSITYQVTNLHISAFDPYVFGGISGLAITPDSQMIIIGCRSKILATTVDLATMTVGPAFSVAQGPKGMAMSSDRAIVYVVTQGNSSLNKVNWQTRTVLSRLVVGSVLTSPWPQFPPGDSSWITLDPSKTTAYITGTRSGRVTVVNLATFQVGRTVDLAPASGPFGIASAPDGTKIYVALYGSNQLASINTSTWAVTYYSVPGTSPIGVAVTPNGGRVLVANALSDTVTSFTFP